MNFHSRLVGALDALILAVAAFITIAMVIALVSPLAPNARSAGLVPAAESAPS